MSASLTTGDSSLAQAEWLPILFAARPTRADLQSLTPPSWPLHRHRVRIHRNFACEFITSAAGPYLALAGLEIDWLYGTYDDSLGFASNLGGEAAVEIIWLDHSRLLGLGAAEFAAWVGERIAVLRSQTRAPILFVLNPETGESAQERNLLLVQQCAAFKGVYACDAQPVHEDLGSCNLTDERNHRLVGLPFSNQAAILLARLLGCRWLPAVLLPALKAVVADLDQTLYKGVLGEDGPAGIELTTLHTRFQQTLLSVRASGLFLAVCSKNDADDVWAMFAARPDMPVRPELLSAYSINWESKASGLRKIAAQLRIGLDSMLMIDDNPGELASITAEIPEIRLLHAGPDPEITARALVNFPGLHRWRLDDADTRRIADLAIADLRRQEAEHTLDSTAYLRSLRIRVGFRVNLNEDIDRLQSLSMKTNQFNLALRRLSEVDVGDFLAGENTRAVAMSLSDRLSDSGIIGAAFLRILPEVCQVEEVCISCRALGRDLEDLLVLGAIRAAMPDNSPRSIELCYAQGPRNEPARKWLQRLVSEPLGQSGVVRLSGTEAALRLRAIEDLLGPDAIQIV